MGRAHRRSHGQSFGRFLKRQHVAHSLSGQCVRL
jgi:hypothetical protein